MNKTREQIANIIEPCMNKTLSEGCLFITEWYIWKHKDPDSDLFFIWDIYDTKSIDNTGDIAYKHRNQIIGYPDISDEELFINYKVDKIIGHYDTTAVFDYMNWVSNKDWVWPIYFDNIVWTKDYWVCQKTNGWYIKIPKKPLHLYSDEQDKQLLIDLKEVEEFKTN